MVKCFRALKSRSENLKGDFLTQNNLRTPHPFRLKNGLNANMSHTNHILPRRFQGAFLYYDMGL